MSCTVRFAVGDLEEDLDFKLSGSPSIVAASGLNSLSKVQAVDTAH